MVLHGGVRAGVKILGRWDGHVCGDVYVDAEWGISCVLVEEMKVSVLFVGYLVFL